VRANTRWPLNASRLVCFWLLFLSALECQLTCAKCDMEVEARRSTNCGDQLRWCCPGSPPKSCSANGTDCRLPVWIIWSSWVEISERHTPCCWTTLQAKSHPRIRHSTMSPSSGAACDPTAPMLLAAASCLPQLRSLSLRRSFLRSCTCVRSAGPLSLPLPLSAACRVVVEVPLPAAGLYLVSAPADSCSACWQTRLCPCSTDCFYKLYASLRFVGYFQTGPTIIHFADYCWWQPQWLLCTRCATPALLSSS